MTAHILPKLPPKLNQSKPFKSAFEHRQLQSLNDNSINEFSESTINYDNGLIGPENRDLACQDQESHFRKRIRMLSEFV